VKQCKVKEDEIDDDEDVELACDANDLVLSCS